MCCLHQGVGLACQNPLFLVVCAANPLAPLLIPLLVQYLKSLHGLAGGVFSPTALRGLRWFLEMGSGIARMGALAAALPGFSSAHTRLMGVLAGACHC
jgi:hypothetical protein